VPRHQPGWIANIAGSARRVQQSYACSSILPKAISKPLFRVRHGRSYCLVSRPSFIASTTLEGRPYSLTAPVCTPQEPIRDRALLPVAGTLPLAGCLAATPPDLRDGVHFGQQLCSVTVSSDRCKIADAVTEKQTTATAVRIMKSFRFSSASTVLGITILVRRSGTVIQ